MIRQLPINLRCRKDYGEPTDENIQRATRVVSSHEENGYLRFVLHFHENGHSADIIPLFYDVDIKPVRVKALEFNGVPFVKHWCKLWQIPEKEFYKWFVLD